MTTIYRGVIKDRVVVLPEGVELADGSEVEVHVLASDADTTPRARIPDAVKDELLARGLVIEFKDPPMVAPEGDRTPVRVEGKPLSEMIIEERR